MSADTLGSLIAQKRKETGKTLRGLAPELGISVTYLNDIEHGRRCPTHDSFIETCAHVLSVSSDYLYCLSGKLPPDIRTVNADDIMAAFNELRTGLKT